MNSTLFISMFVLLPLAVIIAWVLVKSKQNATRKKNELMRVYLEIVRDNHLEISDEQVLYDKILAIDATRKVFVFLHNHDSPVYNIIQIGGLSGCKVEKKGITLTNKRNGKPVSEFHVNEVYLSLLSHDALLTDLRIYSEILDSRQEYATLTKIAEDWQRKLNALIKS